jgi:hypothetical protein
MNKIHSSLGIARWTAAICVAYAFVHAGSGALTQLALSWHNHDVWNSEDGLLCVFGLTEIVGAAGLFAITEPLRALSAVALLVASLAPRAGLAAASVPAWCVIVTGALALVPGIPRLWSGGRVTAFRRPFVEVDVVAASSPNN